VSIWSTVFVTIERYVSVVHPRLWFCTFSSIIYIVPILFFSVLWNIPCFMELKTCHIISNVSGSINLPKICPTFLRKNFSYTRDYILIANFLVIWDGGVFIFFVGDMPSKSPLALFICFKYICLSTFICSKKSIPLFFYFISRENKITKETLNFQTGRNIIVSTAAVNSAKTTL
jgi:hypothetical protein